MGYRDEMDKIEASYNADIEALNAEIRIARSCDKYERDKAYFHARGEEISDAYARACELLRKTP
jgi:hypothetical protein